jgi:hypothetical protein
MKRKHIVDIGFHRNKCTYYRGGFDVFNIKPVWKFFSKWYLLERRQHGNVLIRKKFVDYIRFESITEKLDREKWEEKWRSNV